MGGWLRRNRAGVRGCVAAWALAATACGTEDPGPMPRLLSPPDLPPPPADAACAPAGGPAVWVLEGEELVAPVGCSAGPPLDGASFQLPDLPPGAEWDPARSAVVWRPGLHQAGVWHLPVHVPSLGESGVLRIGVVENWAHPGNIPVRHPSGYGEELGLPVLHVFAEGELSQEYVPARFVYRGRELPGRVKLRGNQSLKYPKKNFTVDLDKPFLLDEPSAPGGFRRPEFVLTSNFDDTSHLRQRLVYELWNELDPRHVPLVTFPVALYLDGEYHGLYLLGDHVDKHLLEPAGIPKRSSIYKAVRPSADWHLRWPDGRPHVPAWAGFEKKEGEPEQGPGAFDELVELLRLVDEAPDEELRRRLPETLRLEEFARWWQLVRLVHGMDSVYKNYYLVREPGGAWRCIPWDFNASFGQDFTARRLPADAADEFADNRLFERLLAEPAWRLREGLAEALDGPFDEARLVAKLDAWARDLEPAALRDEQRWDGAHARFFRRVGFGYRQEVDYVRAWIAERAAYLRLRYPAPAVPPPP